MIYIIGLGLNDEGDLTLKAIDKLKLCEKIYAEFYTNIWQGDIKKLEKMIGKDIIILEREKVESEFLIKEGKNTDIALLVPGDPLSATTHFEIVALAKQNNIKYDIIHAPSIYTAIAETGLQLYKFGRSTTIPKFQKGFEPSSPYEVIESNKKIGYHTLVLLDIGMKVKDGLNNLLKLEDVMKKNVLSNSTKIIACAKLGNTERLIIYDSIQNLINKDIQDVPAVIIFPGNINFKEEEYLTHTSK
ncbi:MAG: diphthine synthase [Candidatus Aenigmarchaeota archaeon]|nr:diphthine synthase [Candidatus Aenigmarchaeota archaeon]